MEIEIIESKSLSKNFEKRYIVVQKNNRQKVLDDAQGFGFKSKQKAFAAYHFKNKSKKEKEIYNIKIKNIKSFIENNASFFNKIENEMFYSLKDNETFDYHDFKFYFEQENFKTNINPYDIWKIFIK